MSNDNSIIEEDISVLASDKTKFELIEEIVELKNNKTLKANIRSCKIIHSSLIDLKVIKIKFKE